jgi:hypothetical protein
MDPPGPSPTEHRCSAVRLSALQSPSRLDPAAALPHVHGLSPARSTTAAPPHPHRSAVDAPIPRQALAVHGRGAENGWLPCSRRFARWRRSPTVSLRHRHEYAVDLPRGLPNGFETPDKEFPTAFGSECAPPPAQIRQVRAGVVAKRRKDAGSSRTPLHLTCRTRTIWQYWHVPALSGLLPPSPALPGSGCPQLRCLAATRSAVDGLSSPLESTAPHGARARLSRALRTVGDLDYGQTGRPPTPYVYA